MATWLWGYAATLPWGVLQISSDRDDRRIWGVGVEIFYIGNFLGKKILATCFATVLVFWKFLCLGNSA